MSLFRKNLGRSGEKAAEKFLKRAGHRILSRNYSAPGGELDLVTLDGECIVFVEVKTRRDDDAAAPESAINATKQRHMLRAATHWLHAHGHPEAAYRFDAVSVVMPERGEPQIRHIIEAFIPSR